MRIGDTITVIGTRGQVSAKVLELRSARDMPAIPFVDCSEQARAILSAEFLRVAVIGYEYGPQHVPVMFIALEDQRGTWWDLHGQAIILEETPCPAPSTAKPPCH
jgi:hypothetical protein